MKKATILMTVLALLGTNSGFAQTNMGKAPAPSTTNSSNGDLNWLIGLGTLAVVATVVGVTVASATDSPSTYSHSTHHAD